MQVRSSEAIWRGTLKDGNGTIKVGEGAFEGAYSFRSRFEDGEGTNPEALLGAAHAGCFSMDLASRLAKAGYPADSVHTTAKVHLEKDPNGGFHIPKIELHTEATVPGIDEETFQQEATNAKEGCPLSKVLAATEITLDAKLVS